MRATTVILGLDAAGFLVFGGLLLFDPTVIESVGLDVSAADARVEVRAMFGGLELGIAAFLLSCLRDPHHARLGVAAGGFAYAGLAAGRACGLLWDRPQEPGTLVLLLVVELLMAALSAWGWRLSRASAPPTGAPHAPPPGSGPDTGR